jgi:molybdenum cofactor cytidylyltransferase
MLSKENKTGQFGIIILAAGASARLGHPKQLLSYHGKTLLEHSLNVALKSEAHPVVVVLGAEAEKLIQQIDFAEVQIVNNAEWKEGLASSIRCGVEFLRTKNPEVDGAILMMCDQPAVNETTLNNLIEAQKTSGKPIIASGYDDTYGPPVLFSKKYFDELLLLKNDIGARAVVRAHAEAVEIVPFEDGSFDIDTEEDFEKMRRREFND